MDAERFANPGALETKAYVPGKPIAEVEQELHLTDIIKMASNENVYGSSEQAREAIRQSIDKIHLYPSSLCDGFRAKLAPILGCRIEQITVGNGADDVLHHLGMACIDQDDEVIIPEITFPLYKTNVQVMRGRVVPSGMKGLRIDLEDIRRKITPGTKAIFVCNPNNPTGDALPAAELTDFLRRVPDRVLVVLDEAYIEFAEEQVNPSSLALFQEGMHNLFIVRTLSKIHGLAGVRIGYGIGDAGLVSLIHRIKSPFNVSFIAEQAGVAALSDDCFARETLVKTAREKEFFYCELEKIGLDFVRSQTNFILIDVAVDSMDLFDAFLKRGIIVRPGKNFGLPNHLRVTLGTHDQNVRFFEILKELLRSRKPHSRKVAQAESTEAASCGSRQLGYREAACCGSHKPHSSKLRQPQAAKDAKQGRHIK